MKAIMQYRFFGILLVLIASYSCSDDLGNYKYSDINEISVGLKDSYEGLFGAPILIEPNITSTLEKDDENYSFEWYAYENGVLIEDLEREPIATTKNLDLENLPLGPGTYNIVYRIMDVQTEIEWINSFELKVESSLSKGWLILNDVNGESRLDMISEYEGENHNFYDVLMATGSGLELEGAPVDVMTYPIGPGEYGVYITTEGSGTTRVDPTTFGWEETFRLSYETLGNFPDDLGADFIQRQEVPHSSLMFKDGNIYYYYRTINYRYSTPINAIGGVAFKAAPFISGAPYPIGANILYDEDNKKFVRHNIAQSESGIMPDGTLFDYNTGMDLIYMTQSWYNGGETFAILKESSSEKLFLARIMSDKTAITQRHYSEIPENIARDMLQSKEFAVSPDFGYIFYEKEGKVFEYDFSLKSSKIMIDKPNSEITILKFDHYSSSPKSLLVASYDKATNEGVFELYNVPPINGDLELEESFEGFGIIKSIAYKEQ